MPSKNKVGLKKGRNPGKVPSVVNNTQKPPGARNLDGTPYTAPKSNKES